jgi:hypothetical protein
MNAMPKQPTPEQKKEQPSFVFFRATPTEMMKRPPLASSLQSFETCLLLIALGRFPSALASCAAAVESVIKAKLGIAPEDQVRMWELIEEVRRVSPSLRLFDKTKLEDFRETRNRVVHYGYTPKDDEVCAAQLLETGFPFLEKCYSELFGFDLMSKPSNGRTVGLEPKVREQYRVCREVYRRARELRGISYRYCFDSLAHYVRFVLKDVTMTVTERSLMEVDTERGVRFEHEESAKQRIGRAFKGPTHEFDCPICDGQSTMIAALDEEALRGKRVSVRWCLCVSCEMLVSDGSPYLADELLRVGVAVETKFLKEFGIG